MIDLSYGAFIYPVLIQAQGNLWLFLGLSVWALAQNRKVSLMSNKANLHAEEPETSTVFF